MFAKTYARKLTRRDWVLLSVFVIALAGIVVGYINNTNDTAGSNSIVERIKQNGTLAHPYADAGRMALDPEHPSRVLSLLCWQISLSTIAAGSRLPIARN